MQLMTKAAIQPQDFDPELFCFGWQPEEFKGRDAGQDILVIGAAGDVFNKFIGPQLRQRGGTLHLVDPSPKLDATVEKLRVEGVKVHAYKNINEVPRDVKYTCAFILTPPALHLPNMKELNKVLPHVPVAIEKPLVGNPQDMKEFAAYVAGRTPPYCIDWALLNMGPLARAIEIVTGKNNDLVGFPDAIAIHNGDAFKRFDINNLIRVKGFDIEGGGNSLGNVEAVRRDRPWMFDIQKGGGVTYDMTVHLINVLLALGFHEPIVTKSLLGEVLPAMPAGSYSRIIDDKKGELYSYAEGPMHFGDDRCDIPYVLESGKNGAENNQFISLTDHNNLTLHWEILPVDDQKQRIPGSICELRDADGSILASIHMPVDCYALAVEQAVEYATEVSTDGVASFTPNFFDISQRGIKWVAEIHDIGRNYASPETDGDLIEQVRLSGTKGHRSFAFGASDTDPKVG